MRHTRLGAVSVVALRRALVAGVFLGLQFVTLTGVFFWQLDAIVDSLYGDRPPLRLSLLALMAAPVSLLRRAQHLGTLEKLAATVRPD